MPPCSLAHLSDGVQIGGVPVVTVTAACDRVTDEPDLLGQERFQTGELGVLVGVCVCIYVLFSFL